MGRFPEPGLVHDRLDHVQRAPERGGVDGYDGPRLWGAIGKGGMGWSVYDGRKGPGVTQKTWGRVCKGKMLELPHLRSRADTNQWPSRNDRFFDTAAGCELGPAEEAAVSDGDGDSAVEADEASAEEESEDEQSSAEEDHAEDHDRRALCAVPRDRRRALGRRYRRHGLKFSRPPPTESPA